MRVLIFSHENDIDGMGGVILGNLAFEDVDYILSPSVTHLESTFRTHLESGTFDAYDRIFITDLALANPSLELVSKDEDLSKKITILDHHASSVKDRLNIYDFTIVMEEDENGKKRCGTDLFYEYLTSHGLLDKSPALDDFVELTRLEDTWDWKNAGVRGQKAHDLAILFGGIGIDPYIESLTSKIKSAKDTIELSPEENAIITSEKEKFKAKMEEFWESAQIFEDEFGNRYASLFADYPYRNEIAEYVRALDDNKGIKYIIIIALEKPPFGQKSYRSIEADFDVNVVAMAHGGGGHQAAASVNITEEQREKCLTLEKKDRLKYLSDSKYTK